MLKSLFLHNPYIKPCATDTGVPRHLPTGGGMKLIFNLFNLGLLAGLFNVSMRWSCEHNFHYIIQLDAHFTPGEMNLKGSCRSIYYSIPADAQIIITPFRKVSLEERRCYIVQLDIHKDG